MQIQTYSYKRFITIELYRLIELNRSIEMNGSIKSNNVIVTQRQFVHYFFSRFSSLIKRVQNESISIFHSNTSTKCEVNIANGIKWRFVVQISSIKLMTRSIDKTIITGTSAYNAKCRFRIQISNSKRF